MKRLQKVLLLLLASTLILPSFLANAATNEGKISSKDEVVYATLNAAGTQQEIYVVNTLDIEQAGKITDYGSYSTLKNLTDLSEIGTKDNQVEIEAPEGKFYYQGSLKDKALPWDISVTYLLDGQKINPLELAGKDGNVQIKITTSANTDINPVFFTNYLLQVSLTLDPAIYSNIDAGKGMLANAGKNKQVTYTVMPETEEELVLKADVVGFELDGINITAVPSSMSIEAPDIDDMTGDMASLTDAISQLHNGVGELKSGVSELNNGVHDLSKGSAQFNKGMSDISVASSDIVNGSKTIDEVLAQISHSLGEGSEDMNLGGFEELVNGLKQISTELRETATGLGTLKTNYATSFGALKQAIAAIPGAGLTQDEISDLEASDANQEVVKKLLDNYSAAQTVKGTYSKVEPMFTAIDTALSDLSNGLTKVAENLDTMATEVSTQLETSDAASSFTQLQKGLAELSTNYKTFHSGLVDYTGGVVQLSESYRDMHNGIVKLSNGTSELDNGVSELHDGTGELYESTKDLPEQMKEEVDKMISEFDKSDFEAISFASDQNEHVNLVQFVIKTESIQIEEPETAEKTESKEDKGFFAKLLDLFK
ncbi:hypothetical protein [Bacillus sinesaloumensis]|uniref:hypothetical protein n=1 Tax=Litchfieldia sinesaloumensis TaxID=1926280 RepID=UPI000988744F|nr:hypothetical protein [Bacillus sinesaloumensis]